MANKEPKIALYYVPRTPGEGFNDVPKRDLTERDVARLGGFALANATSPGPNGEPPLYQPTKPTGQRAEVGSQAKEQAAAPSVADKE